MTSDLQVLIDEAKNPATPFRRLKELAHHQDDKVQAALLQNPAICTVNDDGTVDHCILQELALEFPDEVAESPVFALHAFYGEPKLMVCVIQNIIERTQDPERIHSMLSLFGHIDPWLRGAAASNPATPPDLLRDLADEWPCSVARNPNTPPDLLKEFAQHPDWKIRLAVASNLSDCNLLEYLSADVEPRVRDEVAQTVQSLKNRLNTLEQRLGC